MEKLKAGLEFIFSSYQRTAAILIIASLALAIPITLNFLGQQQDIRQRASEGDGATLPCVQKPDICLSNLCDPRIVGDAGQCTVCFKEPLGGWCPVPTRVNTCGDGVCQNVACLAIGCPAPETPETCPQDCPLAPPTTTTTLISNPCSPNAPKPPTDQTRTITHQGRQRTFKVHVPSSYNSNSPMPVVLNFHGWTQTAAQQEALSKMTPKADSEGFIVVYPQGISNGWNAGSCCGTAQSQNINDVGFVSTMIDNLASDICIDSNSIYATGMSNGGMLSHRLACELSNKIAAVGPVAAEKSISSCNPPRPVSIMHFHGTSDPLASYEGANKTFADWATRNNCQGSPVQTYSKGDSHCETYQNCAQGTEVTLCTIEDGGHTWPGGTPISIPGAGKTTKDLNATDAMWDFFKRHPLTTTTTPTPTQGITSTPTDHPSETKINLSLQLIGIGNATESARGINNKPIRPARNVDVKLFNSQNQEVLSRSGAAHFDPASGLYKGTITLGANFQGGPYIVKVRMDNTLWKQVPGIQNIVAGTTYEASLTQLVSGDVNQDNEINLRDYTIFLTCYRGRCEGFPTVKIDMENLMYAFNVKRTYE